MVVGGALVICAIVAVVLAMVLRRSVVAPLDALGGAMARVRGGDLDVTVSPVGGEEIDAAGASFNAMVGRLRLHEEEMRHAQARVVAAADTARRQVERDLHDGAQQRLVLLNLKLGLLVGRAETDPAGVAELAHELRGDLKRALQALRDLAHGIYPQVLESEGLRAALREAAERLPIPAVVDCDGTGRHRPELEAAVYFCCLEALQNVVKHAGDQARVEVRVRERERRLEFEVADDGGGFDVEAGRVSAGLQNMTDRIGALGGRLEIDSSVGQGTRVRGAVPI